MAHLLQKFRRCPAFGLGPDIGTWKKHSSLEMRYYWNLIGTWKKHSSLEMRYYWNLLHNFSKDNGTTKIKTGAIDQKLTHSDGVITSPDQRAWQREFYRGQLNVKRQEKERNREERYSMPTIKNGQSRLWRSLVEKEIFGVHHLRCRDNRCQLKELSYQQNPLRAVILMLCTSIAGLIQRIWRNQWFVIV